MEVKNSSKGWLVLWLEPLGEDRWLKPGETFRVRSDYRGDELEFSVHFWMDDGNRAAGIENITVWIQRGNPLAEVTNGAGNVVECGHQRPEEIGRKWQVALDEMRRQTPKRTSE